MAESVILKMKSPPAHLLVRCSLLNQRLVMSVRVFTFTAKSAVKVDFALLLLYEFRSEHFVVSLTCDNPWKLCLKFSDPNLWLQLAHSLRFMNHPD